MARFRRLTVTEQAAEALREGIRAGRWQRELPGVVRLAEELRVSKATMRGALRLIEADGLLAKTGQRRSRVILDCGQAESVKDRFRVLLLPDRPFREMLPAEREHYHWLFRELAEAGHEYRVAPKSQVELRHDPEDILRLARDADADAWIAVVARRDVLETLARDGTPLLAFGGSQIEGIATVGMDLTFIVREAAERFTALGHRRIVFLLSERFQPPHSSIPRAVLEALARHGIPASTIYNTPTWAENEGGLHHLLDALFRVTPPTAIFLQNIKLLIAAYTFFAERGIRVPAHVSILCGHFDGGESRAIQSLPAHFRTDWKAPLRHAVQWADAAARGQRGKEWLFTPVEFVPGVSLGPAMRER